jgi:drug/metabolite transporter (DMT)-like permease
MAASSLYFLFVTGGLLVCGTFNSLIAKLIYGFTSVGWRGTEHHFRKPWFQTTNMFVGMVLCLPIKYLTSRLCAKKAAAEEQPLLQTKTDGEDTNKAQSPTMVIIPAVADLLATGLMMSGLVFTTASVYQMMRGAQVVFCTILSVVFLQTKLDQFQKMGILITVFGITIVGLASCLADSGTEATPIPVSTQLFGIFLILLAQLVQAVQMIMEQWLLQDIQMDALEVAGYEGLWGSILCFTVFLPLAYLLPGSDEGHLEDSYDSMLMLYHSRSIVLCEFLNCLSVLSYNWFGLVVTQDFTAMHRVIIEASRSLMVWISDLVIFYVITDGAFGEAWTWSSWLQLLGFGVLLSGTIVYNYTTLYVEAHLEELQKQYPPEDLEHLEAPRAQSVHSGRSGHSRASNRSIGSDRVLQTRW